MGTFAKFECGARGNDVVLEWYINNVSVNNGTEECFFSRLSSIGDNTKSILCVNATKRKNNARVTCLAQRLSFIERKIATLTGKYSLEYGQLFSN